MKNSICLFVILILVVFKAKSQSFEITPQRTTSKSTATDQIILQSTSIPDVTGRRHAGTFATPTAISSGSSLLRLSAQGHNGTAFAEGAGIYMMTSETWNSTSKGTSINFYTTANGTNSLNEKMRILGNGNVGIGIPSPTNRLHIAGGGWNLANATDGDFKIGDNLYNYRIGVATGGGGAGDIRMFSFGGTNRLIWGTNGLDRMALNSAGDLGIGTISPLAKVHIDHIGSDTDPHIRVNASSTYSRINWTTSANANKWVSQSYLNGASSDLNYWRLEYGSSPVFNVFGDQRVGIGTSTSPNGKLGIHFNSGIGSPHIYLNEISSNTDGARITFANTGATATKFWDVYGRAQAANADAQFNFWYETYGNVMILKGDGNVGIGTANTAGGKLNVNGIVRANEVVVETGWADYVFENDYKLKDLNEVEKFILENKHLPDVPSAKEIQEKGAHVSELMTKMMAKIEELTLHAIRQQKEIEELKSKIKN